MSNILITGGAGYVGSICAEQLLREGHGVVSYDNLSNGHLGAVAQGVEFVKGDVADWGRLFTTCRIHQVDAVMHFASSAATEASLYDPAGYYDNNVVGTLNLLDVLKELKIKKFIFSSSAAVYGEPKRLPIEEGDRTCPLQPYGETKLLIERALPWYASAYGISCAALRYFNVAGASAELGENPAPATHVISRLLNAVRNADSSVEVYGADYPTPDGTCVRDFVHVLDVAQAHSLVLRSLQKPGLSIYNVGSGVGHSVRQVIDMVEGVTGRQVEIRLRSRRPGDPAILIANCQKLREELGWKPWCSDLRTIVEAAWAWLEKHPHGYDKEIAKGKELLYALSEEGHVH